MRVVDPSQLDLVPNPHEADARMVHQSDHIALVHMILKPGQKLKPHITPVDVIFYVISGRGLVTVGDEVEAVAAGVYVDSPKGIVHCWENIGDESLEIIVIKTPKPASKTRIL